MSCESRVNSVEIGKEMHKLISDLYPICRSITGNGLRQTLDILRQQVPLEIHEVPSGTAVFDWTIPREWNIRDAYVRNSQGEKVIDFQQSNLHVVSYSIPVRAKMPLDELKKNLFTLPEHPDWIPYRTSYYKDNWGFCLSHNQLLHLKDDEYEISIDATLEEGRLSYGEYYIKGDTDSEVLISSHVCHPSLANDNLSGVIVALFLAKHLGARRPRYSYRFLFIPGTIGSIAWLCRNEVNASKVNHGLVLACMGDPGQSSYKKSRRGNAEIDQATIHVLKHSGQSYEVFDFSPYGYDERQFCSPGFNLPVGCLMRTPHGRFPEYHTSADNLEFIQPQYLADSFSKCLSILEILENNRKYLNRNPKCEPQLGKRGLYRSTGGDAEARNNELAMLWILNLSDGNYTLLDIAEKSGLPFDLIKTATDALLKHDLLTLMPD
jgi:aminopeptidase-like protein